MWIYLATEMVQTQQQLEEDEIVEIVRVPVSQALEMITTGEIEDAKTIIGLMLAAPRVGPSMLEVEYPAV
jgi:ADP-ribose pyrophosphatase